MKPAAPRCMGMNIRGLPSTFAPITAVATARQSIVHHRQQLLRLAEDVERAATQAAVVSDTMSKGGIVATPQVDRVAHAGHLPHVGAHRGHQGARSVGQREQRLERLTQRRRGQQRPAEALQEVHVGEPPHGRQRHLPEARRSRRRFVATWWQREAVGVGQEGVDLVGLDVLAPPPTGTGRRRAGRRPASGPAWSPAPRAVGAGHAVQRREVPAELERRFPQRIHAHAVVVAGVTVGDALDPRREVLRARAAPAGRGPASQGDDVVEALLALCVELGVRPGVAEPALRGRHTRRPLP